MSDSTSVINSLLSPRSAPDPYPAYRALRQAARTHYFKPLNMFLVTGFADCLALHRDQNLRVINSTGRGQQQLGRWPDEVLRSIDQWPVYQNPPVHGPVRHAVSRHFTPAKIESLRQWVERQFERELDRVAEQGAHGAVVDLQASLKRLPMVVMSRLLGLPRADLADLIEVVSEFSLFFDVVLTPAQHRRLLESHDRLIGYLIALVAPYRRATAESVPPLIAGLISTAEDMSNRQLAGMIAGLLLAGFETTVGLLGNGAHALALHPDQARLLAGQPRLAPTAVEEALRWDASVQVNCRIAGPSMEVGGVPIPEGAVIGLMYGSAHRDPERYRDPDRFDITRVGSQQLSFGMGIHYCLGSQLARLEAMVAFTGLVRRFPKLRLAEQPRRRRPGFSLRALETLPVLVS
ncbi:cytochrome P450 [Crossiella sp. SN42]|uniref:cytochrome P450 n=1 Tax=Crossiella sp. SN42 TaxID=2944808 RepID=UPI00207CF977|nr:cytochrome P450 [Crossiella sp. SN42]MCO1580448.1 cytochrome P450 [Crossiella sp. SN42]